MKNRSRLQFTAEERAAQALLDAADDQEREDENAGTDAARASAGAARQYASARRSRQRGAEAAPYSNPASRQYQRRAIRKQYAAAKSGRSTGAATAESAASVGQRAKETAKKVIEFTREHKRGVVIAAALLLLLSFLLNGLSSCSVLLEGVGSGIAMSTYPSEDADMRGAETQYSAMEAELRHYLDTYEAAHDYDEYHYDLDEIKHDPYVLLSIVTALKRGGWTLDEARDTLQSLFDRQYTLTESVQTVPRFNEDGERYDYTICTVTLDNFDLSHLPVYIMGEEQLGMYATYMATLGNRPDLYPLSEYVNKYVVREYADYEIPASALEDERFAAIIEEAEKYLGYPYVWGGSSPSTSFDCSGFVSWVINHCRQGWDVGRLGATSLYYICTPVSRAQARPGDLVFFIGTYDTPGMSHVGIYVGSDTMLHCGDPIQYANLNTSYWQAHLYGFGRLP